jgi:tetratricopeptide (TPR) repeat protein/NAD-dependent dihydropyrimidine dehydrogenase PreA subunit
VTNSKKRATVLILVHVLIAVHVAHWLSAGSSFSPLEPSEAMEFSKHDLINAGFVFFGLTILSTLVLGRWFCGWACHLVALQDLCLWLLKRVGIRPRPLRSRALALVPSLAALYMFAWPLIYRLWVGDALGSPRVELMSEDFWGTFPPWSIALATFAVCGFVIVYFLGAKGFCTYACPYGAIFGLVDRFAVGRIRVTDACEGCAQCTLHCTSNVLVHAEVRKYGMVVDPNCLKCTDCISVCPKNALYFGLGKPAVAVSGKPLRKSLPWTDELVLGAFFVAAFLTFRGLYGVIPFLLALGWAAILACCFAGFVRVLRRSSSSFMGRTLKDKGRLTRAGRAFIVAMGTLSLLFVHSGLIQFHSRRSAATFAAFGPLREGFLDDPLRELPEEVNVRLERALASTGFLGRYGLLRVPRNELHAAWFLLMNGSPAGFEDSLRAMTAAARGGASLRYDLARFLLARGRASEAAVELESALDVSPRAEEFDRLARIYLDARLQDRALAVFERGLTAFPENPDLHFNSGVLLGLGGRYVEAAAAFSRVLELDPERIDARENIAGLRASGLIPKR